MRSLSSRRPLALLAATLAAALLVVPAGTSSAGRSRNVQQLFLDGTGPFVSQADGSIRMLALGEVWFRKDTVGRDAILDVRLSADDGTLPSPGECEDATAHISVHGFRRTSMTLGGAGSVCGRWTDQTYVVTHVFTGRYEVTEARRKIVQGTDGFFEVGLATDGEAYAYAVDT